MTYLIFHPGEIGFLIYFASVSPNHYVGALVMQEDGTFYFRGSGSGGLLPDYILREILVKMDELNKES